MQPTRIGHAADRARRPVRSGASDRPGGVVTRPRAGRWPAGLAGLALTLGAATAIASPPGLLVTPTRVVFEGRTRHATLTLSNTGTEPATYRISFIQMEMAEDGQIREVPAVRGGAYSDSLVRFSPRQVTLQPGVPQTVRLQLRPHAGLPDGEYRSHLLFRALPAADDDPAKPKSRRKVSIKLEPVYGVAIPVIVRQGEARAVTGIRSMELRPTGGRKAGPFLRVNLTREGNRSVYGDVVVTLDRGDGRPLEAGRVNCVAVYVPTGLRRIDVPLNLPASLKPGKDQLRVAWQPRGAGDEPPVESSMRLP